MQMYANHIQIHIKIASCVPPQFTRKNSGGFKLPLRVMSSFPSALQTDPHLEGGWDGHGEVHMWGGAHVCGVIWGRAEEASEDS